MAEGINIKDEKDVEMFQINVPLPLAKRIHKFMEGRFMGKTTFALQAFDAFLVKEDN
jgi:hypothetical protein